MSAAVIIVAAGQGRRFSSRVPKQFLDLNGKPVFLWSVLAFKKIKEFRQIIVVVPKRYVSRFRSYEKKRSFEVTAGGKERYDSVMAGLKKVNSGIDYVAIHDAARPLITKAVIARCLSEAKRSGAALVAVAAKDTVKMAKDGLRVKKTIPRNTVWLAQTPQIFNKNLLVKAYSRKFAPSITDDAQAVENMGKKVKIVPGSYSNLKITEPLDLKIAALLLKKDRIKN